MRQVTGSLRTDLAQFRELAAFAQFGSDLDASTRARLERGMRATEVLKQLEYQPLAMPEEAEILFALVEGELDDVPVDKIQEFEQAFHQFMGASYAEIREAIASELQLTDEIKDQLRAALHEFKQSSEFVQQEAAPAAGK
jgi:F-type H+-transporting ATPase subunit alpha